MAISPIGTPKPRKMMPTALAGVFIVILEPKLARFTTV
jgi:hypothetical protein